MNKRYFQVDTSVAHLYKITNKKTDEYYVGKHCGWDQRKTGGSLYWGSGERIRNAIKKHGKEYFTYEILAFGSVDYIIELEAKYVTKELIEEDSLCMNLMTGGEARRTYSKESVEKAKRNRSKPVFSEDARKRMSEKSKGNKYALGYKHTEEAKEKLREIRAKQVFSEESKIKQLESIKRLVSMNNGERNFRIKPELVEEKVKEGYSFGWLPPKFSEEVIQKLKNNAKEQWKKHRETNPFGGLKKV
jgi:hypothetical protein